jgi:diguanylate cyclase (GGDEF)-like protein
MAPHVITIRRLVSLIAPGALLLCVAWALQHEESVRVVAVPYAPYICFGALAAAALLSWYHNYSRVLCAAVVIGLAVWSLGRSATVTEATNVTVVFLLPLNLALFATSKERGLATLDGFFKAVLIAAQVFGLRLLTENGSGGIDALLAWGGHAASWTWMPWSAHLAFAVTAVILLVLVYSRRTNVEAGLLWTLAAVFVGLNRMEGPAALYFYCGGAGLVLMFSVLEHGFDMTYRDELTGLPGRRAFNEVLKQLHRRYTIVMCDVDHFKQFNDTYGHDAGDQVLKTVALKLSGVKGGGRAYRYGGEEFALIFKGRSARDVEPYVESLREAIARMRLALNTPERPLEKARPKKRAPRATSPVNITVSIGIADDATGRVTPKVVLEAADAALYRAKESGRNCVKLAGDSNRSMDSESLEGTGRLR